MVTALVLYILIWQHLDKGARKQAAHTATFSSWVGWRVLDDFTHVSGILAGMDERVRLLSSFHGLAWASTWYLGSSMARAYQASTCLVLAKVPLAKASHQPSPDPCGRGLCRSSNVRSYGTLEVISVTLFYRIQYWALIGWENSPSRAYNMVRNMRHKVLES